MDTILLALHVTAAAVLVGPQVLMFFAVVPATWFIENDEKLKRAVLATVAQRFGMMFGVSLVILVLTGIYQYMQVPADIRQSADHRFAMIFTLKMVMLAVLLVLVGFHALRFSRRISALSDEVIAGRGDVDALNRARLRSFSFSILILLASLAVLWLGVALGQHEYSWALR